MALASDPVSLVLIGIAVLIVIMLLQDQVGSSLQPTLRRYRVRYIPSGVSWKTFVVLGLAVVLAVMMHTPLISAYLIVAGLGVTWWQIKGIEKEQHMLKPNQILQFIVAFRGEYYLQPSVFSMLDKVTNKLSEPLKGIIKVTAQTYFLTSSPERAFAELRTRTDNVYLNQFAYILEMSETASPEAVVESLDNLVQRLNSHDELRRDVQAGLSSIHSQTLIMQVIAAAILLAVAAVPMLRRPYITTAGQAFYCVVMTGMLGSSFYIQHETSKLQERIS